jgi:hypothetical protein
MLSVKPFAAFDDKLKPTTEHPQPGNFYFEPSVDKAIEGNVYRV